MTLLLTGVVVITRPSFFGFTPDKAIGYIAAWMVPVLSAFVSIWTRQCRNVNAQLLMFWFGCGSLFWAIIGGKLYLNFSDFYTFTNYLSPEFGFSQELHLEI